jgi:Regulator of Chromosome Condensation (RCC1) repeat protein
MERKYAATPVEVRGISNATQVAAGQSHSCALLSTGHVDCWGGNHSGELGDGLAWSEVPKEVVGLSPGELSGSGPSSPSAVPGGSSPEDVSSSLTGLSVGTSYHYRLVAVNAAGGISYGADKAFKTVLSLSVSGPLGGAFAGSPIPASLISATLTAGSALTGTITFTVFGPQSSTPGSCASGGATVGTASVSGNGSYQPSAGFTPPSPGEYWWYASYGGDASDEPAASTCGALMAQTLVAAASTPGSGSGSGARPRSRSAP